jgi:hypothetical protein
MRIKDAHAHPGGVDGKQYMVVTPQWTSLAGHPSTPGGTIQGIDARVQLAASGIIVFQYVLCAELFSLRIPPAKPAEHADGLWRHTCFEAFMMAPGAAGYYELNFAPSLQWAAYRFEAYREGMSTTRLDAPPEISVRRFDDRLEVDAAVHLHDLNALQGVPRLRVALSAVVEGESGTLSYWALKHAPGMPDFHNPDCFVLELAMS